MNGGKVYYTLIKELNNDIIKIIQKYTIIKQLDKKEINRKIYIFNGMKKLYNLNSPMTAIKRKLFLSLKDQIKLFCNESHNVCKCGLYYTGLRHCFSPTNYNKSIHLIYLGDLYHGIFHEKSNYTINNFWNDFISDIPQWIFDYTITKSDKSN
jgi:hypothetical protein